MPSNKELTNEANNLADELGLTVETDGLKNDALVDLVADLRAKKRDAENDTQADNQAQAAPTKAEPAVASGPVVAEGRSVTTKRGILAAGASIRAEDLSGGESSLQKLIKVGAVKA